MKCLLLILSGFLFFSCATIFNSRETYFTVQTSRPATVVIEYDTVQTVSGKAKEVLELDQWKSYFLFEPAYKRKALEETRVENVAAFTRARKKGEELNIRVSDGSGSETFSIRSRSGDPLFMFSLLTGVGALVDLTNPRRFMHNSYYLDLETGKLRDYPMGFVSPAQTTSEPAGKVDHEKVPMDKAMEKGKFYFTVDLVPLTHFNMYIPQLGQHKTSGDSWSIALGADYHYSARHSLALEGGVSAGIFQPVRPSGTERLSQIHISLSDHYHWRRVSVGYGIHTARNGWNYRYREEAYEDHTVPPYGYEKRSYDHWSVGALVNVFYKISPMFRLGIAYRPSFYRFGSSPAWRYGHSAGLNLGININTGKPLLR